MLLRRSQFHLLAVFFSVDFAACICVYSVLTNTGKFDIFSLWSHFLWSQNSVPFFEGTSTGYKKYRSITVPRLFFHLDALLTTLLTTLCYSIQNLNNSEANFQTIFLADVRYAYVPLTRAHPIDLRRSFRHLDLIFFSFLLVGVNL